MTMQDLKLVGFSSWTELAEHVHKNGNEKAQSIILTEIQKPIPLSKNVTRKPRRRELKQFTVLVQEIKANAYDEIVAKLPTALTVDIMVDTIETGYGSDERPLLVSFLKNLQTRGNGQSDN